MSTEHVKHTEGNPEAIKSRFPPPLPYLVGLIAGLILGLVWPWRIGPFWVSFSVGSLLIAVVAVLLVWITRAFHRHDTPADPVEETRTVIDSGPFRFSRNPVYLSLGLLQVALGFTFNNVWILALTLPAMIFVQQVVILREEAYMEAKFGQRFLDYTARVRRWL